MPWSPQFLLVAQLSHLANESINKAITNLLRSMFPPCICQCCSYDELDNSSLVSFPEIVKKRKLDFILIQRILEASAWNLCQRDWSTPQRQMPLALNLLFDRCQRNLLDFWPFSIVIELKYLWEKYHERMQGFSFSKLLIISWSFLLVVKGKYSVDEFCKGQVVSQWTCQSHLLWRIQILKSTTLC